MDEAGRILLEHIERIVKDMEDRINARLDELPRLSPSGKRMRRLRHTERHTLSSISSLDERHTERHAADLSTYVSRDLTTKKEKELPSVTEPVTDGEPSNYPKLVDYGLRKIEAVTGVRYAFAAEDGNHAKALLRRFGLKESQDIFDLAAQRFQSDDFHRKNGLTFRLVRNAANTLRTAGSVAPVVSLEDRAKAKAEESAAKRAEETRLLLEKQKAEKLTATPPDEAKKKLDMLKSTVLANMGSK